MKYRVEMKRRHIAVIFLDRRITSHSKSSWWFSWKSASTRIRSHITLYLFEIKIVIQNDTDNFSQCSNKRLIAHIYRIYRNQVQYWSWFRSLLNHDTKFDLTPTWSFVSTSLFHKGFFSFLDRMLLFLSSYFLFFFFLLPRNFFRYWFSHEQRFFPEQRASTCEFCQVRDVNKILEK